MHVLIVESDASLGRLWARHLARQGAEVTRASDEASAYAALRGEAPAVIVLDLGLPGGAALSVADYAAVRCETAKVIFVTASTFFSDGSIFRHVPNACAFLGADTAPEDIAQLAMHYGGHSGG